MLNSLDGATNFFFLLCKVTKNLQESSQLRLEYWLQAEDSLWKKGGRYEGARSTSQWNNSFHWRVLKQRFGKGDEREGVDWFSSNVWGESKTVRLVACYQRHVAFLSLSLSHSNSSTHAHAHAWIPLRPSVRMVLSWNNFNGICEIVERNYRRRKNSSKFFSLLR